MNKYTEKIKYKNMKISIDFYLVCAIIEPSKETHTELKRGTFT